MGLLASLFWRKKPPLAGALAMPLLPHRQPIQYQQAFDWVRERFPDSPPLSDLRSDEEASTVQIPGGQFGFLQIPAQVPAGDLEWPVDSAWHWLEARAVIDSHQSHVVCFSHSAEMQMIDMRLLHSRVIAGLLATAGGIAVYVGDAQLVKSAEEYIDEICEASRDSLPMLSWIGFNPIREGHVHSAFTTGLAEFGLLELEVRHSPLPWTTLLGTMADIAHHQIVYGVQIGDGDTVGEPDAELHQVRHTRSHFLRRSKVALIDT